MPVPSLPLLLIGAIALLALLLGLWQLGVSRKLRNELQSLQQQIQAQPQLKEKNAFSVSLDQAERQQSSLSGHTQNSTEKYRFVAALAKQGLDAKGIAEALQLAPAEVEQLLQLARLKPRQQG